MPLFFSAQQEAEMLINTSLRKLIKGKVFAFSSPSHNLGGDQAAGDGSVNAFTVCLSLHGLLLAPGRKPSVLSRSTSSLSSHRNLLAVSALVAFKCLTRAHKMQQMLGERKQDSYSWKRVQGTERRRKPLKGRHNRNLSSYL